MTHFTNTALISGAISATLLLAACSPKNAEPTSLAVARQSTELTKSNSRLPKPHTSNPPAAEALEESMAKPTPELESLGQANAFSKRRSMQTLADQAVMRSVIAPSIEQSYSSQPSTAAIAPTGRDVSKTMPAPFLMPSVQGEQYAELENNRTILTSSEPISTFSIDVDTGAYSNVRRFLQNGQLPPHDAVRAEELLNYFSYEYDATASIEQPFSVMTELGPTPWNEQTRLLHIGLKGYTPEQSESQAANLVFLVDVSGSMNSPDKLGLLKSSISLMAHEMTSADTISIVVYAGSSGVVLEPTAGNQHRSIDRALSKLTAGGSTNGRQGIELAYQIASDNFKTDGVNRVILATDGDFNVGISDVDQLKQLIRKKRESGIALTTLGFGSGNYNDHLMEQLADVGNGAYAYIDTLGEARKVLVEERQSTLLTIAKDVKIQVEFNPATVSEYRLIGYTNRHLANEDFNNDKVDAGEIGAGHTVTALYEVALHGEGGEKHSPRRYDSTAEYDRQDQVRASHATELAEVRLRYKLPSASKSRLSSRIVLIDQEQISMQQTSESFRFSASVAAFSQLLRDTDQLGDFDYEQARLLAQQSKGDDSFGYRAEFVRLIDVAKSLDQMRRAANGVPRSNEG